MIICQAYYIDDGVIIKGLYQHRLFNKIFIPESLSCGWSSQRIKKKDIGKTLHFFRDLAERTI